MIHDWKMALYWRLPIFFQETFLSLYAGYLDRLYYGPAYKESRREFEKLQASSAEEIAGWQNERLRSIVQLAATRVPFYRQSWRNSEWQSVRSVADLQLLPRLDKQSLRQNEDKFLAEGVDRKSLWLEQTSGTTGTALRIYWPKSMLPQWWALVEVAIREVVEVGQKVPRAMMGGRTVVHGSQTEPPYWRYNNRWRQLYLSSYHVSARTAPDYVKALGDYRSKWITGYGSAIAALAQCALEMGIPPVPMRAAVVSGDTLLPGMRGSIEQFFDCKCYDSYGQCEAVCMAMECPQGRLHVIPAAGIWEILREDGSRCAPGEVGEIVATGLLNEVMPLVRYRLGDFAAWAEKQGCACGNPQPGITHLEGRVDDYMLTTDGRKVGRLAAFKRSPVIHSAQIVQDRPGHAYLLVRPGAGYRRPDAVAVRDDILERLGNFQVEIVEVGEIPRTLQGKTKLVIRLMDRPEMRGVYEELIRRPESILERAA
ncbi:MAG: phenylacetate--CoA ligase family protein [Candidatus Binatia bacterium]